MRRKANRNSHSILPVVLAALLFLAVAVGAAFAQSAATLTGAVTDTNGASVAGAKIVAHNKATGVDFPTQSESSGDFTLSGLPAGIYRVQISAPGMQTFVVDDLTLDVATTVVQNAQLKVGAVSQEVVVTGAAPVVESGTMSVGQVIDQKMVQEIPLNGRHFVDLGLLIPGTVTPPANGFLTFPLRGQGSFGVNTAGQREDTVNWMVNGINLSDEVQNQITFQPSINTVSEFRVDNQTFSAEYGRNSGAIANIATRSGTNDYHGELFDYLRNNYLDARNFFNPKGTPQAQFIRNNFGAAAGGPIKHDKLFFFASYEGLRQRQGISVVTDVPTDAQRAAVSDPVVQQLLPLIKHVNGVDSKGNPAFLGSISAPVRIDQGTGDLFYNLSDRDRLHGYVAIQQDLRIEATLQGNNLPGFGDTRSSRRQISTFSYDHTFSPTLTNEARLGYNRIFISFAPNAALNPATLGINNGINASIGLPQIGVTGALNIGGPNGFPQARGDTTAVFSDTLSWVRGRHSLAFGGEVRRFYNDNIAESIGSFSFTSIANFLNDNASAFTVLNGSANDRILEPAFGLFVQDNFKFRPSLTFEIGLRYDDNFTPSEARNRFVVFVPGTDSLVQVGTNGIGQAFHTNDMNFQPRVGLAWNPFGDQKTVVRAGYAILTDQPVTNAVSGLSGNPPFAIPRQSTAAGLTFEDAATLAANGGLAPATINNLFDNPYVQSYNFNIQREITPSLGVMAGFFGSKSTHLRIARNVNQIVNGGARPFKSVSATSPIDPGTALGNITEVDSGTNSNYNALWVTVNKHTSHGLELNASYVYSKTLDYNSLSSQGVIVQDSNNIRNDYGPADFDVRNRFSIDTIYDLPFKGNRLIGGWEIGMITQAQSGNPLTILATGEFINGFTGTATLRPDVSGAVGVTGNPANWFASPGALACPGVIILDKKGKQACSPTHFGSVGRNSITGPDFVDTDVSLIKNTKLTERMGLQFRAEAFDLFNHPNFGNPNRVINVDPSVPLSKQTFGIISSTRFPAGDFGTSRQIELALRLSF
ncbi:MAG: TonB-dependent receptor domain-containing protein [Candidatus Acidiferrales bacterium]